MTISEMHEAFKIELDKIDSLNYPNVLPEEIDFLLNKAQDRFVKQRYGTTNAKRRAFEQSQKRIDDIKSLVRTATLTPLANSTDNIDENAQFVLLPNDYWFTVQERALIEFLNCKNQSEQSIVNIRAIDHDNFNIIISNPFEKPNKNKVLRLMSYGRTELIHSEDTTLVEYYLRYIKEPVRVSITTPVDCELSAHTHEEIVNEAVSLAIETLESLRIKTFDQIVKNQQE